MQPDINKYLPMLEGLDLSHDKKIQLIHDLWRIMESFVDRAFGIHPTQQCHDKNSKVDLQDSGNLLESSDSQSKALMPPPCEGDFEHDSSA